MRYVMGVILPLLVQIPVCIWLLFGQVIKVPGGSFVPLGALLLAPFLVVGSLCVNLILAARAKSREESSGWLFFRGLAVALTVPILLALVVAIGSAILD